MGSPALGALQRTVLVSCLVAAPDIAQAQAPLPAPEPSMPAAPPSAPVAPPVPEVPASPPGTAAPPGGPDSVGSGTPGAPETTASPSLELTHPSRPESSPAAREEVVRMRPVRPSGQAAPVSYSTPFLERASPWVDLSLASFFLDNRAGNFLNLGVEVGAYVFQNFRVSARLVAPLEEVRDASDQYGTDSGQKLRSRSLAVLYGASAGFLVTNSRSFVFGPSLLLLRADVEDYGTTVALSLPFEWTTQRNLRVGFEVALGRSFGGSVRFLCRDFTTRASCGEVSTDRDSGASILFQYYMGWSLGDL